jgi:hypothetical protein
MVVAGSWRFGGLGLKGYNRGWFANLRKILIKFALIMSINKEGIADYKYIV